MPLGDLKPDAAELVVLSVLADEPLYGYAIAKRVAARSERGIRLTPGVLYPLLAKLEKSGLIMASWETVRSERGEADGPGRRRKWYRLSAKGRRRLAQRVEAHRAYLTLIEQFIPRDQRESPEGAG